MDKTNDAAKCNIFKIELRGKSSSYDFYDYETEEFKYMAPASACLLAVIKSQDIQIKNSIGQTLKAHNIFDFGHWIGEPDMNAFYKTLSFGTFYKAAENDSTHISTGDVTVSIITLRYPKKMSNQLTESGMAIEKTGNGIYRVTGKIPLSAQIIVFQELSTNEQVWLESLLHYVQNQYVPRIFLELSTHTNPQ